MTLWQFINKQQMRDFNNRGNRFGGNRGGGGFGERRERPTMHKAVCCECGNSCEVPFRPTGDKPVYCRECFEKTGNAPRRSGGRDFGGRDSGRDFRGRDSGRSTFDRKEMYSATCDECGNECEVPFRPTEGKPVYCDQCFGKESRGGDRGGHNGGKKAPDQYKQQFEMLNTKLDKLIKLLSPKEDVKTLKKADKKEDTEKEVKEVKAKEVKVVVEADKKPAKKKAAAKKKKKS